MQSSNRFLNYQKLIFSLLLVFLISVCPAYLSPQSVKEAVVKEYPIIYKLRVLIGSAIFALGVAGAVWFVRNLFRGKTKRAMALDRTNTIMMIIFILAFIIGGMWIHSNLTLIPLIGLIVGVVFGWIVSR